MAHFRIYADSLGPGASEQDAAIFSVAVERLAEAEFDGNLDAAAQYLWGDGNFFPRLPADLQEAILQVDTN